MSASFTKDTYGKVASQVKLGTLTGDGLRGNISTLKANSLRNGDPSHYRNFLRGIHANTCNYP